MLHLGARVAPLRNRTLPYILKVIQDPETYRSNPRRYAVQSIGSVTYHEQALIEPSIQLLLQLVKRGTETSQFVRKAAYIALSRIGRRYPSFQPILLPYFMYPFQHPMTKESVKWGVIIGLGKMAQSNAQLRVNVTRECFTLCCDPAFRIRWAAIKALGHMCCAIGEAKPDERLEQLTFNIACAFITHGGSHEVIRSWYGPDYVPIADWGGYRIVHKDQASLNTKSKFNNYTSRPSGSSASSSYSAAHPIYTADSANGSSKDSTDIKMESDEKTSTSHSVDGAPHDATTSHKSDSQSAPSNSKASTEQNTDTKPKDETPPASPSGISTAEPSPVTTPNPDYHDEIQKIDVKTSIELAIPTANSATSAPVKSESTASEDDKMDSDSKDDEKKPTGEQPLAPGVLTEDQWRKDDVYLVQYAATHALALLLRSNPSKWWARISVEFGKILLNPNVAAMSKAMVMITYGKIAGFMAKDSHFYTAIKALLFELCSADNILVSEPATYGLVNFALAHPEMFPEVKALVRAKLGGDLQLAQPQQLQYYLKTWCKLIVKDFSPMNPRSPVISDQQQLDRSGVGVSVSGFKQSLFEGGEEDSANWRAASTSTWKSTEKAHTNAPEARGIVAEKEKFEELCADYSASVLESIHVLLTDISSMDDRNFILNLKALVLRYKAKKSKDAPKASEDSDHPASSDSKSEMAVDTKNESSEADLSATEAKGDTPAPDAKDSAPKPSILDSLSEELRAVITSLWELDKNLKEAAVSMLIQPALLEDDIWLSNLKLQIFNAVSKMSGEASEEVAAGTPAQGASAEAQTDVYKPSLSSATSMRLRDQLAQLMSLSRSTTFALDPVMARNATPNTSQPPNPQSHHPHSHNASNRGHNQGHQHHTHSYSHSHPQGHSPHNHHHGHHPHSDAHQGHSYSQHHQYGSQHFHHTPHNAHQHGHSTPYHGNASSGPNGSRFPPPGPTPPTTGYDSRYPPSSAPPPYAPPAPGSFGNSSSSYPPSQYPPAFPPAYPQHGAPGWQAPGPHGGPPPPPYSGSASYPPPPPSSYPPLPYDAPPPYYPDQPRSFGQQDARRYDYDAPPPLHGSAGFDQRVPPSRYDPPSSAREYRDTRDVRDSRDPRDTRDLREYPSEPRGGSTAPSRDSSSGSSRGGYQRDQRETRDQRDTRDTRDTRDSRGYDQSFDRNAPSSGRDYYDSRAPRDTGSRDIKPRDTNPRDTNPRDAGTRDYRGHSDQGDRGTYQPSQPYQADRRDWSDSSRSRTSAPRDDRPSRDYYEPNQQRSYDSRSSSTYASGSSRDTRDTRDTRDSRDSRDTRDVSGYGRDSSSGRRDQDRDYRDDSRGYQQPRGDYRSQGNNQSYEPNPPRQQPPKRGNGRDDHYPEPKRGRYQ